MNTTDENGDPREPSPSEVAELSRYSDTCALTYLERSAEHPNDPVGWWVVTQVPGDPITRDFFGLDYEAALDLFSSCADMFG